MPTRTPYSPRHNRTPAQREQDLVVIGRLYLDKRTQKEIADWIARNRPYSLDRSQIAYDLRTLRNAWRSKAVGAIEEAQAVQLAHLDLMERGAWDGWELSKADFVKVIKEIIRPAQGTNIKERVLTVRKTRSGDPRFLQLILSCIDQRAKLLGLYR